MPEEVSEEPPVPKNVETTWTLVVGQPEGSTCWDAAESFAEALADAKDGGIYVLFESGAIHYANGMFRTDHVWKIKF